MRPAPPGAYRRGMETGPAGGAGRHAPGRLRASDSDRADAVAVLRQATAEGYLTLMEFEERLDAAFAARYQDELASLLRDLPRPAPAAPPAEPRPAYGRRWLPPVVPLVVRVCLGILLAGLVVAVVANFWVPLAIVGFVMWRRGHRRRFGRHYGCGRRSSFEYV